MSQEINDELITKLGNIIAQHSGRNVTGMAGGGWALQERLRECLTRNNGALQLVLPAMHLTTNEGESLLGSDDDRKAVKKLSAMVDELNRHVPATLKILSEGHVFNDLLGVSDAAVDEHYDRLKKMPSSLRVEFTRAAEKLGMVWTGSVPKLMREELMAQHGEPCTEPADLFLYARLLIRKEEPQDGPSDYPHAAHCDRLAHEFCRRAAAHTRLISQEMPHALQLSAHRSDDWGRAMPVCLRSAPDLPRPLGLA